MAKTVSYLSNKKTLISLAGVILFSVILNASMTLFGFYSAKQDNDESLAQLDKMAQVLDTVKSTEIHFKRQVQEWKNILLRGHLEGDYQKYLEAFENEQRQVNQFLEHLSEVKELNQDSQISTLIGKYAAMNLGYQKALTQFAAGTLSDARAVDSHVRGIDRAFSQDLSTLAVTYSGRVDAFSETVRLNDQHNYATQRTRLIVMNSINVALVFLLLIISLARQPDM